MATELPITEKQQGVTNFVKTYPGSDGYRCHLAILSEEDGSFSAIALNLPGAGSCGETEVEAEANAREAVEGVIQSYVEDGLAVPWEDSQNYVVPAGCKQKWITVNV